MSVDDVWNEIEAEMAGAERYFFDAHVETKREALEGTFRKKDKSHGLHVLDVLTRRNISRGNDNLDCYRKEGRGLFPRLVELFEAREFTPEFVAVWTRVQFCHGFLVAHAMDDSDDQTAHRSRLNDDISGQKRWLAEFVLPKLSRHGQRKTAFDLAISYCRVQAKDPSVSQLRRGFFRRMLSETTGGFTEIFSDPSKSTLKEWASVHPEESQIPG